MSTNLQSLILIKNVHLIRDHLTEEDLNSLQQAAYLYASQTQLYFKVHNVKQDSWTVDVRQYQTANGHYFTKNEMAERTKELFGRYLSDRTLHVRSNPYHFPDVQAFWKR